MHNNIDPKTQKEFFNLKSIKYKRIANAAGSLISFNNPKQKTSSSSNIIEFPIIDNPTERETKSFTLMVLQKKILEQEMANRSVERTSKSLSRHAEESRKRRTSDCMNMLGLDVIRIQCLDQYIKTGTKRVQNYKKMSRISQKMGELKLQKQFSRQLSSTQRKNTEQLSTLQNLSKLQMTDSFILTNKRGGYTNSVTSYNMRKISTSDIDQSHTQSVVRSHNNTVSPKKLNPRKKEYLYKKLEGTENKKKEEFGQVYQRRIKSYIDFLFKVQISYNFVHNLDLKPDDLSNRPKKLKAYVGPGNNGAMIKGLLKRRFWWTIVDERTDDCHFVWTQIKINDIFNKQLKTHMQKPRNVHSSVDAQISVSSLKSRSPTNKKRMLKTKDKQTKFFQNNELYNHKLMNTEDQTLCKKASERISQRQRQLTYQQKLQYIQKPLDLKQAVNPHMIHNHLKNNFYLGNKKALFHNLKEYYTLIRENIFDFVPLTFHIKNGMKDPEYLRFCEYHKRRCKLIKKEEKKEEEGFGEKKKTRNIWIVKPGQNSNQGRGITVIDEIYELNSIMKQSSSKSSNSQHKKLQTSSTSTNISVHCESKEQETQKNTFIVQMYIDRPFLYNNRKFDIRHYMLITNFFGVTRAYWYEEGYIRTSSYEFNVHCFEPEIHLTNDAVQKNFPDYHKYEAYNKVSYEEFQRYLDLNYNGKRYNFKEEILPKMKKMATDAAKSVFTKICPQNPMNNFEIYGLDFMIDKDFKPWLIEINTNPCLDCACLLLDRIIPYMVEQSFKLSLDVLYPPTHHYPSTYRHFAPLINLETFKYELIFDSLTEGQNLIKLYKRVKGNLIQQIGQIQEDQVFKDDGKEIKLDDFTINKEVSGRAPVFSFNAGSIRKYQKGSIKQDFYVL